MTELKPQAAAKLSKDRLLALRASITEARTAAQGDAEGFAQLVVALEDLGAAWQGEHSALGQYEKFFIQELELGSDLEVFERLFSVVRRSRNTAVHTGAWARHATTNAVDLALLIEDALARKLMRDNQTPWRVEYFMVRDPYCAQLWQGISDLRRCMLRNSFSYLPVAPASAPESPARHQWHLLSDHALARWLGEPESKPRKQKEQLALAAAIDDGLELDGPVTLLSLNSSRMEALDATLRFPALVSNDRDDPSRITGIVTAFDLL